MAEKSQIIIVNGAENERDRAWRMEANGHRVRAKKGI